MSKHACPHTHRKIFSKGRCKECAMKTYKPLKRTPLKKTYTPIRKVSKKRQQQLDQYYLLQEEYLKTHTECQAKLKRCTGVAQEIHHMKGRENQLLLATEYFLAICEPCHNIITAQSKEAIEEGNSISRHKVNHE